MFNKVVTGHSVRRHSKVGLTAMAVATLALLTVTQVVGSASAMSQPPRDWECDTGTACLWKHSPREGNTSEKLVITLRNDEVPHMEVPTTVGPTTMGRKGVVRSTTPAFHDNISQGRNRMAWDLCMIDTQPLGNGEYQNWGAIVVIRAGGGEFWAGPEDPYNDVFDTYTTARPGECPSHVRFNGADSYIIESS